jgi:hypothetical protein
MVLDLVDSPAVIKYSIDSVAKNNLEEEHLMPTEFLHKLTPPGMPPHSLTLKVNGIYMLLRNMNVEQGLCNGSRFVLKEIKQHTLICKLIATDPSLPELIFILPRITSTTPTGYPFEFQRRQFPIRPAFAMTINKSQGGTFEKIGLDLTSNVFSHGQLYVAFSRVHDYKNITVLLSHVGTTTRNVVFPGVFDKGYINEQIKKRGHRHHLPSRMETDDDFSDLPPPQPEQPSLFDWGDTEDIPVAAPTNHVHTELLDLAHEPPNEFFSLDDILPFFDD